MNKIFSLFLPLAVFLYACSNSNTAADPSWPENLKKQVGQVYEIKWSQSTETAGDAGSSGSSRTRTTHIEKVLEVEPDGLVLEYDMPDGTSDIDRRRSWQLPARVRITPDGSMSLLNADELKVRNADWLAWGNYDQSHCGKWLFTWTAQKIECDPNSVIDALETYNIRRANLTAGRQYRTSTSLEAVELIQKPSIDGEKKLEASLELDPGKVREERVQSDLIVAQIMGAGAESEEDIRQNRQNEKISGTIKVTYTLDAEGYPIRRVKITEAVIINTDGVTETLKTTETVERKLLN